MTGAILAGGAARRMGGRAKGLVEVDGVPVAARLRDLLDEVCDAVFVVGDPEGPYAALGLPVFPDLIPDKGAPGGVYTALRRAERGPVFVAACDLPHLDLATVTTLRDALGDHDVALYRAGKRQFLAAWWQIRVADHLEGLLRAGDPGFAQALAGLDVNELAADPRPFFNLNTPEDLRALYRG